MPDALSKSTWSTLLSTDLLDLKKKLASSKARPPGSSPAKMHSPPQRLAGAICDGRCCSGTASASASPGAPHHRALHGLGQNCQDHPEAFNAGRWTTDAHTSGRLATCKVLCNDSGAHTFLSFLFLIGHPPGADDALATFSCHILGKDLSRTTEVSPRISFCMAKKVPSAGKSLSVTSDTAPLGFESLIFWPQKSMTTNSLQ